MEQAPMAPAPTVRVRTGPQPRRLKGPRRKERRALCGSLIDSLVVRWNAAGTRTGRVVDGVLAKRERRRFLREPIDLRLLLFRIARRFHRPFITDQAALLRIGQQLRNLRFLAVILNVIAHEPYAVAVVDVLIPVDDRQWLNRLAVH